MEAFLASLVFVVLAEMGDKTQLATVALAVEYNSVFLVWYGTTLGMLIADGVGIIFGVVMGKRIPERTIKWAASMIFIGFGGWGLYDTLPSSIWTPSVVITSLLLLATSIFMVHRLSAKRGSQLLESDKFCEIVEPQLLESSIISKENLVKI
jgi:hypothetical protein